MAGHVFIVRGDLTKIACDVWLMPCGEEQHVAKGWFANAPVELLAQLDSGDHLQLTPPPDWGEPGHRVMKLDVWPDAPHIPQPWLVHLGGWKGVPVSWYLDGVREFLDAVGAEVSSATPRFGRSVPLVAMPLVGTGFGGAGDVSGAVVRELLELMQAFVESHDVDLILVTYTGPAFAAAQSERKRVLENAWTELGEDLCEKARELGDHARRGNLVLFLGAGVSAGAGLPTWDGLLAWLAQEANLPATEVEALGRLNSLDQARILSGRLAEAGITLGTHIAQRFDAAAYSLAHAALASLPVNEIATMNYDTLFEQASDGAGRVITVVPYDAAAGAERWLLKLHGSISNPEDIVLTREDYMRYSAQRQALAGIVQAMLLTRHMLFIGFALTDDNFHRIADDVRKAVRSSGQPATRAFGTALVLEDDPLMEELWAGELECVSVARGDARDLPATARRLEIFLDCLLAEATNSSAHLLDDDFVAALTPAETQLREALLQFKQLIPLEATNSTAWDSVARPLHSLGDAADDDRLQGSFRERRTRE